MAPYPIARVALVVGPLVVFTRVHATGQTLEALRELAQ